jgi:hypothetical protein
VRFYEITDWVKRYENSESRKCSRLNWVKLPVNLAGDGYTEIVTDHPNGPGHFAVWVCILEIAASCQQRGVLIRDNGKPHDPATIARVSRLPVALIEEALPRLVSVGWITETASSQSAPSPLPVDSQSAPVPFDCPMGQSRGDKSREEKNTEETPPTPLSSNPASVSSRVGGGGVCQLDEAWTRLRDQAKIRDVLPGSDTDWTHAWRAWKILDGSQKLAAIADVGSRDPDSPEMRSLPSNYVRERRWERPKPRERPAKAGSKLASLIENA